MSTQIRASHILIGHTEAGGLEAGLSRDDAVARINQLKTEIDGGADFAELAKDNSDCPSSQQGGDLGMFGQGAMVAQFDEVAFGLEVGDVSDVVETQFGFHLIHRTE